MNKFSFRPEGRPITKYVPDYELAYLSQRYTEIHDMAHVLMNLSEIHLKSELWVKYFEMVHFKFPVVYD